jgi:hypothetical protein
MRLLCGIIGKSWAGTVAHPARAIAHLESSALFAGGFGAGMKQCARLRTQHAVGGTEDFSVFDQLETNLVGQAAGHLVLARRR